MAGKHKTRPLSYICRCKLKTAINSYDAERWEQLKNSIETGKVKNWRIDLKCAGGIKAIHWSAFLFYKEQL